MPNFIHRSSATHSKSGLSLAEDSMAEFNRASGVLGTHLLRGRGARRSSGGNDQWSRGQDTGDERGIPMAPRVYVPSSGTPPPSYREVVLAVPAEAPLSEDGVALAAKNLGHIHQLQQERFPEREGRWIDDADEQASRRHYGWDRWHRRSIVQWKQHYMWVFTVVLMTVFVVFVFGVMMRFLYRSLLVSTKDFPYEERT